ncbi:PREDICTED: cellular nucleic acid-binding protein [Propithecus coquereli]|uniref:cellular nucleic acid-binding protein n=1 Tax=Propithecus coquereli TaxID=379532 RepID=UPI00063F28F4|nr:PREDICTED: cellular nucleic acid-binding protein [Propithecus coquereli]
MSSNECFKCGRSGHWARECPTGGGRGRGMRSRGRGGFTSDRGFQFVSSSLPDICYRCGESGHLAKDCDLQEDGKYLMLPFHAPVQLGERDQSMHYCTQPCKRPLPPLRFRIYCMVENSTLQRFYRLFFLETGSRVPWRCGETGHVAINCSKTSEVNCYRCGESGHLARECTIEATA